MDTYFAPAQRTDPKDLVAEIKIINSNPVMTGLLHSINGLLAILDEHRQVVALNDSFLKMLGLDNAHDLLGLRPGEALQCIHAHDEPAGCGTSQYCSTCGAAIAIVSSLEQNNPVERICALTAKRDGQTFDIALLVRSNPITIDGKLFLMLFLQDITVQQQRAALERTFFHDITNMLNGVIMASGLLARENDKSDLVKIISQSSFRLAQEIKIQSSLLQNEPYQLVRHDISPKLVTAELQSFFAKHPATLNKHLSFSAADSVLSLKTDFSLLLRVLCNMITNALEATDENGAVKVWFEQERSMLSFCVWNDKTIREDVALRIFQRNFSTKEEAGRGIGTYSMKLFGEKFLGGKVSFTTSPEDGTVFKISLPS